MMRMPCDQFRRTVLAVTNAAGKDGVTPWTSGCLLRAGDGMFTATATDRHLLVKAGGYTVVGDLDVVLVDAAALARAVRAVKPVGERFVEVEVVDVRLTITYGSGTLDGGLIATDGVLHLPLMPDRDLETFPNDQAIARLLGDPEPVTKPAGLAAVDPHLLARLAASLTVVAGRAGTPGARIRVPEQQNDGQGASAVKPIRVDLERDGVTVTALVMPIRTPVEENR